MLEIVTCTVLHFVSCTLILMDGLLPCLFGCQPTPHLAALLSTSITIANLQLPCL
jgi:hypothetical protein